MNILRKANELRRSSPTDNAIIIGLAFFILWFIGFMSFMENGQFHIINIAFIGVLTALLIGFERILVPTKYKGYILAIASMMISTASYYLLSSFFIHTEIIFTLAIIAVAASYGVSESLFTAFLATIVNGLLVIFFEHRGFAIEIFTIGGFYFTAAFIVGVLTHQRESALRARARMNEELNQNYTETLHALVSALDCRDSETGGHSERVRMIALAIANQINLSKEEIQQIDWGGILHDVGKIGVPDNILRKAEPLTDEEWKIMRTHPLTGFHILESIPFLKPALDVVLHHHERFDGTGYPSALKGSDIPLSARIFTVADSYDAMTNDRPYRKAFTKEAAVAEIQRCANSQFDPYVVLAFNKAYALGWEVTGNTTKEKISDL